MQHVNKVADVDGAFQDIFFQGKHVFLEPLKARERCLVFTKVGQGNQYFLHVLSAALFPPPIQEKTASPVLLPVCCPLLWAAFSSHIVLLNYPPIRSNKQSIYMHTIQRDRNTCTKQRPHTHIYMHNKLTQTWDRVCFLNYLLEAKTIRALLSPSFLLFLVKKG